MRKHRQFLFIAALCLSVTTAVSFASREDRKTEITVHEKMEVPGAVLEPGEYTIELLESAGNNHVVIFRASDDSVLSTVMALPAQRTEVTGETKFTFYETPAGSPPALRTWFYPGDRMGQEFVYPESRGREISSFARRHVPTMTDDEFNKMRSQGQRSSDSEPLLLAVKEITVYSISPEQQKADYDEGRKSNLDLDRKARTPDQYVQGRELDESRLARQIRKEIVTLPYYSIWDNIEFRVSDDGGVTLMGKVYRPSMKKSVERVVENVEGVRSIENQIDILPTSSHDDDIRRAVRRAVYSHPALQDYQLRAVPPIHIIVENGNVSLEGVVGNEMDKNIAGVQANSVPGVFKVENNLRVES